MATSQQGPAEVPRIVLRDVVKRYGKVTALGGVGFDVHSGEVLALLGPNGAGKTTAIDILLGLRSADAGEVYIFDSTPGVAVSRGRVGAMLQHGGMPEGAKVIDVLRLICALYRRLRTPDELASRTGLSSLKSRRVETLSGGEKQRLRFALALAGAPDLLLLDEPTVSLDVAAREEFWATAREAADGGTAILFATHYLAEADANASRVVVLHDGGVVADGPPSAIKSGVATRTVRCVLTAPDPARLGRLPGVTEVRVRGQEVLLRCADADKTIEALFDSGEHVRDLHVTGADLADALGTLTSE